jgi:hypothetical protein
LPKLINKVVVSLTKEITIKYKKGNPMSVRLKQMKFALLRQQEAAGEACEEKHWLINV